MSVRYVIRLVALLLPSWRTMLPHQPGSHELPQIH
jgi:hypothetical protein